MTLGSLRHPGRHRAQSRAARARAKAERAREEKAGVEAAVAEEQAAAIARAKQEDDVRAREDLEEVAEEEAEAVPWNRPVDPPGQGLASARHGRLAAVATGRPRYPDRHPGEVVVYGQEGRLSGRVFMLAGALFIRAGVGLAAFAP